MAKEERTNVPNRMRTSFVLCCFVFKRQRALKCFNGFRLHTLFNLNPSTKIEWPYGRICYNFFYVRKYPYTLTRTCIHTAPSIDMHRFFCVSRNKNRKLFSIASLLIHSNYGYLACLTTMITTKMLTIER